MPTESFAACVARHTALIEHLVMVMCLESDANERTRLHALVQKSLGIIEDMAKRRMEASRYEQERREGHHLGETVRVVAPRRA